MSADMQEALKRLADACDAVGVQHFDTDTMSDQVAEMQEATRFAREALASPAAQSACLHCDGTGEIETDNNGPIVPCPVCKPAVRHSGQFAEKARSPILAAQGEAIGPCGKNPCPTGIVCKSPFCRQLAPPAPAVPGEAVAIDSKRETAAFSNWAWLKEGEPIGRMGGQAAGIAAWMARAQLSVPPAPAVQGEEWGELFAEVRDNILHGRGHLDGVLDNDQTNAVLGEIDRLDLPDGWKLVPITSLRKWRDAFAEEIAAWDIDPPLHHVKTSHDEIEALLAAAPEVPRG